MNKIAPVFGLVFIVFSALAGTINYELNKIQYPGAPTNFLEISIVWAMIPYILLAVLSFVAAYLTSQEKKSAETEMPSEPRTIPTETPS